jgi:type I site-specific restriction-modification system R (restriction) subunit
LSDTRKHGNQQNNIVAKMCEGYLMNAQALGDKKMIYIEYGAGKAGLSAFVAQKLAKLHTEAPFEKSKIMFLVVDRESRRLKKDKLVKDEGFIVER